MAKKKKSIMDEMFELDEKLFKDVVETANRINTNRKKILEPFTLQGDKKPKDSFVTESKVSTKMSRHVKNGSGCTASA